MQQWSASNFIKWRRPHTPWRDCVTSSGVEGDANARSGANGNARGFRTSMATWLNDPALRYCLFYMVGDAIGSGSSTAQPGFRTFQADISLRAVARAPRFFADVISVNPPLMTTKFRRYFFFLFNYGILWRRTTQSVSCLAHWQRPNPYGTSLAYKLHNLYTYAPNTYTRCRDSARVYAKLHKWSLFQHVYNQKMYILHFMHVGCIEYTARL